MEIVIPSVFLDGDDTLWKTQCLYDRAKEAYVSLVEENGIHEENIITQLDELDAQRVASKGFTIERFVGSMLILYRRLARKHGTSPNSRVEANIRQLATYLRRPPELYDDALPTLRALARQAHLFLVSVGEVELQQWKVDSLNIRHYFEQVYVVPTKNSEILSQILQQLCIEPQHAWFVGNSPRTDIVPAVRAGMNAILVNRGTWRYDDLTNDDFAEMIVARVHIVGSLSGAMELILKRMQGETL